MQRIVLSFVSISQCFMWDFNINHPQIWIAHICSGQHWNVSLSLIFLGHVLSDKLGISEVSSKTHWGEHQPYLTMALQIFKHSYIQRAPSKLIVKSMYVLRTLEFSLPWKAVTHSSIVQGTAGNHGKRAMKEVGPWEHKVLMLLLATKRHFDYRQASSLSK